MVRHAAVGQWPHQLFDLGQSAAQTAGWVEFRKIINSETPHLAGYQCECISQCQHCCRAGGGGQAERTGLLKGAQVQNNVSSTPQPTLRPGSDGNQWNLDP